MQNEDCQVFFERRALNVLNGATALPFAETVWKTANGDTDGIRSRNACIG
jgi:hypothetical protein